VKKKMSDRQKRVALFISHMRGGGAQRATLKLAGGIAEHGYAVDLVLAKAEGPFLSELPESVRLVDLNASRVLFSTSALIRYLRRERPAAMLSALHYVNIVALWARRLAGVSTRVVVSERNQLSHASEHGSNARTRLMPYFIRRFYPWADGIVAVSQGVADDLAQMTGLPHRRIAVIYNPIVTPELQERVKTPLQHPWLENGQPPVVLAAGRLKPQKDFSTLIQAFALVRRNHLARLLILGEGSERPALEALVRESGLAQDVSLPGFVANPYPHMTRASLFVLSSRWEGLPGVLIEAMYCGAPLIATNCPSGPREILKDGQYGLLVPVGDVAALARAIEMALRGKVPRPPRESWRPFELKTIVKQYLQILVED
jgi:glycosyltransferase involved in cell wall biosynthesis